MLTPLLSAGLDQAEQLGPNACPMELIKSIVRRAMLKRSPLQGVVAQIAQVVIVDMFLLHAEGDSLFRK